MRKFFFVFFFPLSIFRHFTVVCRKILLGENISHKKRKMISHENTVASTVTIESREKFKNVNVMAILGFDFIKKKHNK